MTRSWTACIRQMDTAAPADLPSGSGAKTVTNATWCVRESVYRSLCINVDDDDVGAVVVVVASP